jgi:hypothetical protein
MSGPLGGVVFMVIGAGFASINVDTVRNDYSVIGG